MPDPAAVSAPTFKRRERSILVQLLPPAGSLAILLLLIHRLDWGLCRRALGQAHFEPLIVAIVIAVIFNILMMADKWRRVLNYLDYRLSLKETLFIKLGSAPLRFFFPLKTGELLLPVYLKKEYGYPLAPIVSTIIFDKFYNLLALLVWLGVGLLLWEPAASYRLAALPCFLIVLFFLSLNRFRFFIGGLGKRLPRVTKIAADCLSVFNHIPLQGRLFLFVYSLVFQLSEITNLYLIMSALGHPPTILSLLVFSPLNIILSKLPITVSGIGLRETFLIYFYAQLAPSETMFLAGVLLTLIEYVLPHFAGLPLLPRFLRRLSASAKETA